MTVGYVRSAWFQDQEKQIKEIEDFAKRRKLKIDKIYKDNDKSGFKDYKQMIETVKQKDIIIITDLQALGMSSNAIMDNLIKFKRNNILLINLEIPEMTVFYEEYDREVATELIRLRTNMYIEMYASMVETNRKKRKDAQRAGIARKMEKNDENPIGRPRIIPEELFLACYKEYKKGNLTVKEARDLAGISSATWYKYRNDTYKDKIIDIDKTINGE